ncbi:MAG: site-specific DNA-methyltransferase [Patescibacteria group bacterium]
MAEVADSSVDLIYAGPPYNIGTRYGSYTDNLELGEYHALLRRVFSECYRVLTDTGMLVIECADSLVTNGTYLQLAGYMQAQCISLGFHLHSRHINFARSVSGVELPEEHWDTDYSTRINAHSNSSQLLVLSKDSAINFDPSGKILYYDYEPIEQHPCPTPVGIINFILDAYFKTGMTVLDPFMGTAAIGKEVVRRGGAFIGYERDASVFAFAKRNLNS